MCQIEKLLANVWTGVDNLLNKFDGGYKVKYVEAITESIKWTTEIFMESEKGTNNYSFFDLGLTDSLLLNYSKACELLITSDSRLSGYAVGNGIRVFDLVKNRKNRNKN